MINPPDDVGAVEVPERPDYSKFAFDGNLAYGKASDWGMLLARAKWLESQLTQHSAQVEELRGQNAQLRRDLLDSQQDRQDLKRIIDEAANQYERRISALQSTRHLTQSVAEDMPVTEEWLRSIGAIHSKTEVGQSHLGFELVWKKWEITPDGGPEMYLKFKTGTNAFRPVVDCEYWIYRDFVEVEGFMDVQKIPPVLWPSTRGEMIRLLDCLGIPSQEGS